MEGKVTTRGGSTHDKVDPKVEHVRRVECRASGEPFGAKGHPPANAHMRVNYLPAPLRGDGRNVPAVKFGRAEHDDPVIPRRIALHDLVYDQHSEGRGAKHGQQLERDDRRVCGAPAFVGRGVFTPCVAINAYMCGVNRSARGRGGKGKKKKK
jgi:hypothetical protein